MRRRRARLVLLVMLRRPDGVMSVYRVDVKLIGDSARLLAEAVARLYRRRRLHRCQVRVPALFVRAVSSSPIGLSLPMRRGKSLILVRTTTGTRGTTGSQRRRASSSASACGAAAATASAPATLRRATAVVTAAAASSAAATATAAATASQLMLKIGRIR